MRGLEEKIRHYKDSDPFLHDLLSVLLHEIRWTRADCNTTVGMLGDQIKKLEEKSHTHITDKIIHKRSI